MCTLQRVTLKALYKLDPPWWADKNASPKRWESVLKSVGAVLKTPTQKNIYSKSIKSDLIFIFGQDFLS